MFLRRTSDLGVALSLLLLSFAASSRADDSGLTPPPEPSSSKLPDVETGFDPRLDAPVFENNGDYRLGVMSDCFGMSLVAIDNFQRRRSAPGPAAERPKTPAYVVAQGDLLEEELAARLAIEANQRDEALVEQIQSNEKLSNPKNPAAVLAALERMKESHTPEILSMSMGDPPSGHMTVLYGSKDGKLLIYDPNYPTEIIEWPFDPKKGFGPHPKGKGPDGVTYGHMNNLSPIPLSKLSVMKEIAAIRSEIYASPNGSTKDFAQVSDVKLSPVPKSDQVVVTGKVSRGLTKGFDIERGREAPSSPPGKVWLRINGELVKMPPASLAKDGTFKVTLPRSLFTASSEVAVIATTNGSSAWSPFPMFAFAGFSIQTLELPKSVGFLKAIDEKKKPAR